MLKSLVVCLSVLSSVAFGQWSQVNESCLGQLSTGQDKALLVFCPASAALAVFSKGSCKAVESVQVGMKVFKTPMKDLKDGDFELTGIGEYLLTMPPTTPIFVQCTNKTFQFGVESI
jgi:hypothetical protein